MPCIRTHRLAARLLVDRSHWLSPCVQSRVTTLTTPRVRVPRHVAWLVTWLIVDYFDYAARPGASERRAARCAVRRQLRPRRASMCLGTSCGSPSTTSTTPRVWVPRHVARLVTRLVAPLVADYFAYTVRPGASAHRAARCRLLRLRRAFGCLGMSCGSSSTASPTPHDRVPQHVARLVAPSLTTSTASRVRVPRHVTRLVAWLIVDFFTSCGSSSTTSPTPRVRVPRHVAWLVSPFVVDYFAYAARPGASARHAARCRLLRAP
jgi:hypothetical protein